MTGPKISDDEQGRHPQAFQVLYDAYRHMDCPAAVDPVDPDDCASVAEESVRVLMDARLLLPPGGEVSTWWGVLNVNGCGAAIFRSRAAAEEHARDYPVDDGDYLASRTVTTWGEGRDQTRLVGPWEVVADNGGGTA